MLPIWSLFICLFLVQSQPSTAGKSSDLQEGFYKDSCPRAESIVASVIAKAAFLDRAIAPGLVRMHFHDCFVRGCDASVLLDATPEGKPTEKEHPANKGTLRGTEAIDEAKFRIEMECPGTVSCADILTFAARDAAVLSGFPYYSVPSGRRDGRSSLADNIHGNLPSSYDSLEKLIRIFNQKGFTSAELVTLSGAHSFGQSRCSSFQFRLQNFTAAFGRDPSLDPQFAKHLQSICAPRPDSFLARFPGESSPTHALDSITSHVLDNQYYVGLQLNRGLLLTDQVLMSDRRTRDLVDRFASDPAMWADRFSKAMVKLSSFDVLTGNEGEVRSYCRSVN